MMVTREMIGRLARWRRGDVGGELEVSDIRALCDLAEAALDARYWLEEAHMHFHNQSSAAPGTDYSDSAAEAAASIVALLSHLAPEEPTDE